MHFKLSDLKGAGRNDIWVTPLNPSDHYKLYGKTIYEICTSSRSAGLFKLPISIEFNKGLITRTQTINENAEIDKNNYKINHSIVFGQ